MQKEKILVPSEIFIGSDKRSFMKGVTPLLSCGVACKNIDSARSGIGVLHCNLFDESLLYLQKKDKTVGVIRCLGCLKAVKNPVAKHTFINISDFLKFLGGSFSDNKMPKKLDEFFNEKQMRGPKKKKVLSEFYKCDIVEAAKEFLKSPYNTKD